MKRAVTTLLVAATLCLSQAPAAAQADTPHIAEIKLFAGNFAPRGWAFCEGQTLPISKNTALFSLLGTMYGGDGRTTFKLPDLRKAEAKLREAAGLKKDGKGLRYIIALVGIYPSRNQLLPAEPVV